MALIKFMPKPQKNRGNNGGDRLRIIQDSKQSNSSLARGRVIGQKFLKSTIYNKKMNYNEITMNLYTYKLNEIPGIVDEIVRCVVTDAPDLKRICFETGYGKPKKAVDIRKCVVQYLLVTLGYAQDRGGGPKTFKLLSDHANRIVIFPQEYNDYLREQIEKEEKESEVQAAKNAKKEAKERKRRQKHFKHNKWKKNLKYPEPTKKRQVLYDSDDPDREVDAKWCTAGGEGEPARNEEVEHQHMDVGDEEEQNGGDSSSSAQVEETEEAFLRNFMNLQVMVQESQAQQAAAERKGRRGRKAKKKQPDIDIFDGAKNPHQQFKYEAPDAYQYKPIKPELMDIGNNGNDVHKASVFGAVHDDYHAMKNILNQSEQKDAARTEWQCEFCSYRNSMDVKLCQMCYNEKFELRYQKFMNVVQNNNKRNEERKVDPDEQVSNAQNDGRPRWACDTCTFVNVGDGEICAMCGELSVEREKRLDAELSRDDSKRKRKKRDKKDTKKQPVVVVEEQRCSDLLLSDHLVVKQAKVSKNGKAKRVKLKTAPKQKVAVNGNVDKNTLFHAGQQSVTGQIANINREWQAQVWKAHNEKQKRIEILKTGGKVAGVTSAKNGKSATQSKSAALSNKKDGNIVNEVNNMIDEQNRKEKQKQRKQKRIEMKKKKQEKNPSQVQLRSSKKREWNEHDQFYGEFVPHNQSNDNMKNDIWNQSPPQSISPRTGKSAHNNRRRRKPQPPPQPQPQPQMERAADRPDVDMRLEWVPRLTEMGFSAEKVMEALAATDSAGCDEALDYLLRNA
eukprot:CAMPEP_0197026250 /NCGR_PEP_ID=MMETSP1384-20130603/6380_1 /TAXON_ID=29189 /ORGANISM="Ammonia sp." /LENGTH=787 /DNA_ID=CAMNT_0042454889 /DNA_START=79 /DNA_END=2442 /DNA_ORIENTATION=-